MQRFAKIETRLWGERSFLALSERARLVYLFLMTHPNMAAFGGLRATLQGLAAEMKWSVARFKKACLELENSGCLCRSETAPLFWVPMYASYNKPETLTDMETLNWQLDWSADCDLKLQIILRLERFFARLGEDYHKPYKKYFELRYPSVYEIAAKPAEQPIAEERVAKEPIVEAPKVEEAKAGCPGLECTREAPDPVVVTLQTGASAVPLLKGPSSPGHPEPGHHSPQCSGSPAPKPAGEIAKPVDPLPVQSSATATTTAPPRQRYGERYDPEFVAQAARDEIPPEEIAIPPSLKTNQFVRAWRKWLAHLQVNGMPLSRWGIEQQLKLLIPRGPAASAGDIEYSIRKGHIMIEWYAPDDRALVFT